MDTRTIRRAATTAAGAIGVGLALVALFLLSWTPQNSEDYESLHIIILLINIAGVLVLFALMVGNLAKLFRDYRNHVPGSRLKARMVGMFVGLAVLPLLVVFYFSIQFINSGIDSWFNIEVEEALDDSLALSQAALSIQMRDNLRTTVQISDRLRDTNPRQLIFELSMLRRESGASEISIYGRNNSIIATSSDRSADSLPRPLTDEVALQIRQNRPFVMLDPLETGGFEIRTAVPFGNPNRRDLGGVIQAHYPGQR
jgi:nitrogen fixation/metabolism regulation signal transduction histidine kinase